MTPTTPTTSKKNKQSPLLLKNWVVELDLLKSCFPCYDSSHIENIFANCNHNVEHALDVLLNATFLEEELSLSSLITQKDDNSFFPTQPGVFIPKLEKVASLVKSSKSKSKSYKSAITKLSIQEFHASFEHPKLSRLPSSNKLWITVQNDIEQIKEAFPSINPTTIRSLYHANHGDREQVANQLANLMPIQEEDSVFNERSLRELSEWFPLHSSYDIQLALAESNSIEAAVEKLLSTDAVISTPKDVNAWIKVSRLKETQIEKAVYANGDYSNISTSFESASTLRASCSGSDGMGSDAGSVQSGSSLTSGSLKNDWVYYLEQAEMYRDKRNEIYRKAASCVRQRNRHSLSGQSGGITAVYMDEGRQMDAEYHKFSLLAARGIVEERKKNFGNSYTIDLHELSTKVSTIIVEEELESWYQHYRRQTGIPHFTIITGVGRHSPNGMPRLHPHLTRYLNSHGWRIDTTNKGRIVVKGFE